MFLAVGRVRGLTLYGSTGTSPTPTWTAPIMLIAALAAQVAFVAGTLALLRAWRLRHERVISRADAVMLARRSTVGLVVRRGDDGGAAGDRARVPAHGRAHLDGLSRGSLRLWRWS